MPTELPHNRPTMQMPLERAAQVYDFVRFLQSHPVYPPPIAGDDDDWLNDREEQMQAEDALWDAAQTRHQHKLSALAAAARTQIDGGAHQPMFDENGKFAVQ